MKQSKKWEYRLFNLPLNNENTGYKDLARNLLDFLGRGWEIYNATTSGQGVVYILKKVSD